MRNHVAIKRAIRDGVDDGTLVRFGSAPTGEKCSHNGGRWMVEDPRGGTLFCFDPATQMQKDIWIGSADRELRVSMLRWLCFECGTVQTP